MFTVLSITDEAKDIFRDMGGIQSVWDTITSTRHGEVTEAGLYCLGSAVERNGKLVNPLHASHIFCRLLFSLLMFS